MELVAETIVYRLLLNRTAVASLLVSNSEWNIGWVYIITTKSLPNLVKVGYTRRLPEIRAKELGCSDSGVPLPYEVRFCELVCDPEGVEKTCHAWLMRDDLHEGKEWFRCSVDKAVEVLFSVITSNKPVSVALFTEQIETVVDTVSTPKCKVRVKSKGRLFSDNKKIDVPVMSAYQQIMNAIDKACMLGHIDHAECRITEGLWDKQRAARYVLKKVIEYIYSRDRDELRQQLFGMIELNLLT